MFETCIRPLSWRSTLFACIVLYISSDSGIVLHAQAAFHSTVQDLNSDNFDQALADPANGFWLLKFYAPWCGHCKKMAPMLDKVAPHLAGKMAIGKIDCTIEKQLCSKYGVRGYPTLKFYRDGETYPYPGERHADSIIEFAEKMSGNSIVEVSSHNQALAVSAISNGGNGVTFVAYDPAAQGETLEEQLKSTLLLQVFSQVARKQQAFASFAFISPNVASDELSAFGAGTEKFIIKIEKDIKSESYKGPFDSANFLSFVESSNIPLVVELNSNNFRDIADKNKIIAIAAIDPKGSYTNTFTSELRKVAINATPDMKQKYIFATMNGVMWGRFLSQFNVDSKKLPKLVLLDSKKKAYWEQPEDDDNQKEMWSIQRIMKAHMMGELQPKKQGSGKAMKKPWYINSYFMLGIFAIIITIFVVRPFGREEKPKVNVAMPINPDPASSNEADEKDDDKKDK